MQEDNVLHDSHNLVCQGRNDLYWIITIYAYILITQFISVFLAFKTRKVKIKALNDAKYITVIIYATSIIVIVMIACAVVLSDHLNADGAVFGGLLYIFATIVLSVLFIPKVLQLSYLELQNNTTYRGYKQPQYYFIHLQMVILYKDPKGEKIFERTHSVSQMTVNATNNCDDLEKYCRELEGRLGKYEVSLESANVTVLNGLNNALFNVSYRKLHHTIEVTVSRVSESSVPVLGFWHLCLRPLDLLLPAPYTMPTQHSLCQLPL